MYQMLNLNMTGGVPEEVTFGTADTRFNVTQYRESGLEARLKALDAWGWEGGGGKRCAYWGGIGELVPA
jgi:hypothetical protein